MSLTQRVALMAKCKHYISGGGSPEMTVDGAASLQPNGLRGPEKCSRAFPLLRETGKFSQALSPKGIKRPKGPKRKLAVVPPYERGELFKRQPSVCAPATEGGSGSFVCWPARPANLQLRAIPLVLVRCDTYASTAARLATGASDLWAHPTRPSISQSREREGDGTVGRLRSRGLC